MKIVFGGFDWDGSHSDGGGGWRVLGFGYQDATDHVVAVQGFGFDLSIVIFGLYGNNGELLRAATRQHCFFLLKYIRQSYGG